jgi:hypothetical protein
MLAILPPSELNRSMRGTAEEQGSFTAIDVLCEELLDEEGFLVTLRAARGSVFCDEDFDVLYPSGRGRPSHPPSVLAALLLAQLFYGVSDREAERRTRLDLSWKDALGLPLEHRGIPHVCLVEFRARVVRAGMAGFCNDKLLQLAKRAGVIGHRRVVDSTGIADSVVTMDTVSLIRSATRHGLDLLGKLDKRLGQQTRAALLRADYDERAKPEINWSSVTERQELVGELVADAASVIAACGAIEDSALREAAELLAIVSAQDIDDDGNGGVKIREGVARERVIFDDEVLPDLLAADPLAIQELIGDTHYGAAKTRVTLGESGIDLVAPAPPASAKKGFFAKADFTIDLEQKTVTCPAGVTVGFSNSRAKRAQARFANHCTDCQLRSMCTTRVGGRMIEINPAEELLSSARAARWTDEFRDRYRERARVEQKNAQLIGKAHRCRTASGGGGPFRPAN